MIIEYATKFPYVIPLLISLLLSTFEFNKKYGNFLTVYLFSFSLGISFNALCNSKMDDKTDVDLFLNKILSYTLCISVMLTFAFMKKKNVTITFNPFVEEKNAIIYRERKEICMCNFFIRSRFLPFGIAFIYGTIGTVIGGCLSYYIVKTFFTIHNDEKGLYLKKSVCCFISTYIGGYINFIEVSDSLNVSTTEKNSIFVLDDMFTNLFLTILPLLKKYCTFFPSSYVDMENNVRGNVSRNNYDYEKLEGKQDEENMGERSENVRNKETKRLICDERVSTSYGSFPSTNVHFATDEKKETEGETKRIVEMENIGSSIIYKFFGTFLHDSLAILCIVALTEKILYDYEVLHNFLLAYVKADKFKTVLILAITFMYLFCMDYLAQNMNNRIEINKYKISRFILGTYFRSIQYYSTVLNFLTIYYLFLSGMLINIHGLFTIARPLVLLVVCILTIHTFCVLFFSYIFNLFTKYFHVFIHIDEMLLAVNANIGGPTTAALMSEMLGRPDLAFAATFWGVIGYLVATHISMFIYAHL
ncbi:conserved Plasmodium protein, unknown function [Plasmodium ovale]|uniref:DUF819 domain-containing protein n=1 Tax=Plasmodium ovale TaxID=36330 RepID=A0A1C3KV98_PLAOA|nr:conserved Plasmodium protein, unknown function [Plasmodium ovale]